MGIFFFPLLNLSLFRKNEKKLGKSHFEHMARGTCFISQDKLGKARKLSVSQKLQTSYREKRQCLSFLASCLPRGAVLCLKEIALARRRKQLGYTSMFMSGEDTEKGPGG